MGLGRYPAMTLRDARNKAADLKEYLDRGINPRAMVNASAIKAKPTVKDCLNYWEENYVRVALRPKTQALYTSTVLKHMRGAFAGVPIEDIPVRLRVPAI
ncbi:hypothetical protein GCM10007905_36120 [Mixta theicola]|nr:hypothetical protein GCM10007905_36120 [Mixta theicola]